MRDTTYRVEFFSIYEWGAIQRHLEEMAAKGWLLQKPGNFLWKFRRVQPRRTHIAVTWFPDASGFDPGPTEGLRTMADYCARDGWVLLCQWGQMQIFMNDREDPVPIETDPVTQVAVLHKAMKRTMLPSYFLLLGVILWSLGVQITEILKDPVTCLSNPSRLAMLPFWLLMLAAQGYELGFYFRWLRRARRAAEDGVFLPAASRKTSWALLACAVFFLIYGALGSVLQFQSMLLSFGSFAIILLLTTLTRDAMKRRGASRWANRIVSIGLCALLSFGMTAGAAAFLIRGISKSRRAPETYQYGGVTFEIHSDPLPLRVEELVPAEGIRYSAKADKKETFLLSRGRYQQDALLTERSDAPELEYIVVGVKVPLLYSLCKEAMLTQDPIFEAEYRPIDPAPWGAGEAFRLYRHGEPSDWYLLAWEDRLVELRPRHLDLTPELTVTLGERLRGV